MTWLLPSGREVDRDPFGGADPRQHIVFHPMECVDYDAEPEPPRRSWWRRLLRSTHAKD